MNIPNEAVEAAARAMPCLWRPARAEHPTHRFCSDCRDQARAVLEAAAPHLMAPILALCDEADSRHGSSMYRKLTTYEVRKALGAAEAERHITWDAYCPKCGAMAGPCALATDE